MLKVKTENLFTFQFSLFSFQFSLFSFKFSTPLGL